MQRSGWFRWLHVVRPVRSASLRLVLAALLLAAVPRPGRADEPLQDPARRVEASLLSLAFHADPPPELDWDALTPEQWTALAPLGAEEAVSEVARWGTAGDRQEAVALLERDWQRGHGALVRELVRGPRRPGVAWQDLARWTVLGLDGEVTPKELNQRLLKEGVTDPSVLSWFKDLPPSCARGPARAVTLVPPTGGAPSTVAFAVPTTPEPGASPALSLDPQHWDTCDPAHFAETHLAQANSSGAYEPDADGRVPPGTPPPFPGTPFPQTVLYEHFTFHYGRFQGAEVRVLLDIEAVATDGGHTITYRLNQALKTRFGPLPVQPGPTVDEGVLETGPCTGTCGPTACGSHTTCVQLEKSVRFEGLGPVLDPIANHWVYLAMSRLGDQAGDVVCCRP